MKKIKNFQRYLIDNGLVFEINRRVLHPLGLSLVVDVAYDNRKNLAIVGLDQTDDAEGFLYDEETFKVGEDKYQNFLKKEGSQKVQLRQETLGFIFQEK
jgi:hypothetical protein